MIARVYGMAKKVWYLLRYTGAVIFEGLPSIEGKAKIKLRKGKFHSGKGLVMKPNSYCAIMDGGKLRLGHNVSIARNSMIVCHEKITIGDHCAIGPNVSIYDHDHRFGMNGIEAGFKTAPVIIDNYCWIGVGSVILRGTHIGEGCIIGAGTIVKGEIPAHSLVKSSREFTILPIEHK